MTNPCLKVRFFAYFRKKNGLPFFALLFFCFPSCQQIDTVERSWQQVELPTSERLNTIFLSNDSVWHVAGGTGYQNGIHLSTYDAGQTWQVDTIGISIAYDLYFENAEAGIATGLFGVRRKLERTGPWFFQGIGNAGPIPPIKAIARRGNQTIIGGGIGFQEGSILLLDEALRTVIRDSFAGEINDLTFVQEEVAMGVGYGVVVRSIDGGASWTRLPIYQDNFTSLHFPSEETGYIVGFSGSILKTTDGGQNWETLRDGDRLSVSDQPFRAVFFKNELEGCIVGDRGLVWVTTDGAATWQAVADMPTVHFYGVTILNNSVFIVGADGVLVQMVF